MHLRTGVFSNLLTDVRGDTMVWYGILEMRGTKRPAC